MTDDFPEKLTKLTAKVTASGCAAKISSKDLQAIMSALPKVDCAQLIAGANNFEDAAVYKISAGLAIVQSLDFFPPMVDDPWLFGEIAATNALSDIYAMGARPILALNILGFPTCDLPLSLASEILKGGASQVALAGAVVGGGHSIQTSEVIYGLAVTGLASPKTILTNGGAKAEDHLILTKPIGTGIALLGHKGGVLSKSASDVLFSNLTQLNREALICAQAFPIHAATDVTGFGLIGHLHEMAKASNLKACLKAEQVPLLPEVLKLAQQGFVPASAYGNRQSFESFTTLAKSLEVAYADLLFDPQTSGGLLLAVDPDCSGNLLDCLLAKGITASCIGQFSAGQAGAVEVIV
jgi:selenide,water dikinase